MNTVKLEAKNRQLGAYDTWRKAAGFADSCRLATAAGYGGFTRGNLAQAVRLQRWAAHRYASARQLMGVE